MDFAFSEEQELFRRTVRQFAKNELLPGYQERDRSNVFPKDVLRKMGDLGVVGLRIPEQYGGADADYIMVGIASEEIARGDFSCAAFITNSVIPGEVISRFADESVKQEWLPAIAAGEVSIAIGLTEPQCGSDAAALATRAERDGDHYVLNGEKSSTSLIDSEAAIIWARTGGAGARSITAFLMPMDAPGVGRSLFNDLGFRAMRRGAIHMDNVRIPARYRLGEEGQGFYHIMNEFDYTRSILGLMCLGAAAQTVDETIEYVKTRTAFGQPIARFQGVGFPIAEALTQIDAARFLCYRALWLRQQKMPHTMEAAMAKWFGPKVSYEIVHQMLLLHGHSGYSDDYLIGQRLRDVISYEIGDGTGEIMKAIICRETIGREFRTY